MANGYDLNMAKAKKTNFTIDSDLLILAKIYARESNITLSEAIGEALASYLNTMPEKFVGLMKSKKTTKTSKDNLQKLIKKFNARDIIEVLEDLEDITFVKTRRKQPRVKMISVIKGYKSPAKIASKSKERPNANIGNKK